MLKFGLHIFYFHNIFSLILAKCSSTGIIFSAMQFNINICWFVWLLIMLAQRLLLSGLGYLDAYALGSCLSDFSTEHGCFVSFFFKGIFCVIFFKGIFCVIYLPLVLVGVSLFYLRVIFAAGREKGCGWFARTGETYNSFHFILFIIYYLSLTLVNRSFSFQVFVRKVIELHDKYLTYVNNCFQNHSLFHKVRSGIQFSSINRILFNISF